MSKDDPTDLLKVTKDTLFMVFLTHNIDSETPWRTFIGTDRFKLDHKKLLVLKQVAVDLLITGGVNGRQLNHIYKEFTTDYHWGNKKITSPDDGKSLSWCGLQNVVFHSRGFMITPSTPGTCTLCIFTLHYYFI